MDRLSGQFCFIYKLLSESKTVSPASEASREVANLTERKPHVWCQRICLSVCFIISLLLHKTKDHFKKSLHIGLPELFLSARLHHLHHLYWCDLNFCLPGSVIAHLRDRATNVTPFQLKEMESAKTLILTLTCPIRRGYEIYHTNFTST